MKKFLQISLIPSLVLAIVFPLMASAQGPGYLVCNPYTQNIGDIICKIAILLRYAIPMLVALGVVYFVWGVITYVIGSDEEAKKKGRNRIIYGIIGFAVILSLFGLVAIVINTFGLTQQQLYLLYPAFQTAPVQTSSSCAALLPNNPNLQELLTYLTCIIGASVIPLIFAVAAVAFLWGVVQFFIISGAEEAKRTQGKQLMIWGIIALTVMVGLWGLVRIVGDTFHVDTTYLPKVKP